MQSFREYLKEQLLNEQPHVELIPSEDQYWDFCAEESFSPKDMENGGWLKQLYNIYHDNVVISLNKDKNKPTVLKLDPNEIDEITEQLRNDVFFINRVKADFAKTDAKFRDKLIEVLPYKLYIKIGKA